ncbi:MAG: adenine phosphoribosyltransferase [Flavobacteriales bacterium]|nr:adenine phosphoribosyltransferase [Flavobacteriales bacterium]MDW8409564.1 adenine phosphoribosyltransferase [Flavobacteriales bacterium]
MSSNTLLNSEEARLRADFLSCLRTVENFPQPGIKFRDIMPVLRNPSLCRRLLDWLEQQAREMQPDAVAAIESRGFFFGFALAQRLEVPFVPLRKQGKLPTETFKASYSLEYGEAILEMQKDALCPGWRVVVHDDLMATGGTLLAAQDLLTQASCRAVGFLVFTRLLLPGPPLIGGDNETVVRYLIEL